MRIITAAVILATAATSTTAFAQARLSDVQFIKVAHCSGLAGDGRFDAVFDANKKNRGVQIMDRADDAKRDAARKAKRAGDSGKMEINAELSGICASLAG
ncbi:MAG: hypothetical protein V4466_11130 [Pseudomonadota bacterium]